MTNTKGLVVDARSTSSAATDAYPPSGGSLPTDCLEHGRYVVRFARDASDLDALLRLRFHVFNLELGEGLASSFVSGRDEDAFDRNCHHLLVQERESGAVVGTYRMQSAEMAARGIGFYSAGEFDLGSLPQSVLTSSVEVGRACIARDYRNRHVLFLLWRGLALYMRTARKRFLFGCCSLSSQDPAQGRRLERQLAEEGHYHPSLRVDPLPEVACGAGEMAPGPVEIPTLFHTYLRYGAAVCSPPALDRAFGTIDFLVLLDVQALEPRIYRLFFDP